jgi:hypothetical protein
MSHFGYLSNQNQGIWSVQQSQTPRVLPVLNWPADLFKCDMIGLEHHEEVASFSSGMTGHRWALSQ